MQTCLGLHLRAPTVMTRYGSADAQNRLDCTFMNNLWLWSHADCASFIHYGPLISNKELSPISSTASEGTRCSENAKTSGRALLKGEEELIPIRTKFLCSVRENIAWEKLIAKFGSGGVLAPSLHTGQQATFVVDLG